MTIDSFDRIQFETTNNCNMNCFFCPNAGLIRKRTCFELDDYKSVINQIFNKNYTDIISFAGNGEPCLDPELGFKLDYAKSKGFKTVVTTNFLMPLILKTIIEKGVVDEVIVSWQTINEKSFKTRGVKREYVEYEKSILDFLEYVKDRNVKITLSMMFNRRRKRFYSSLLNKSFYDLLRQDFSDLEKALKKITNRLSIQPLLINKEFMNINSLRVTENLSINIDEFFDWGGGLDPKKYNTLFYREKIFFGTCKIMMAGPIILANGDFSICCQDFDGNVTLGNVKKTSLKDIIQSDSYKKIYSSFKRKRIELDYCKLCKGSWRHKNKFKDVLFNLEERLGRFIY